MKKISIILSFFLISFVYSCSSINRSLERLGFTHYQNKYTHDLKLHTKSYTLYRDFSTIAKVKVTRFNRKLLKEYVDILSNLKGTKSSKYKEEFLRIKNYDVYYVAFYTPDMNLNNLEDKNSFWTVYLSACGKILKPVYIKSIDNSDWRASWLYSVGDGRWYKEYVVEFEKSKCANPTFVISSYLGVISLKF